MKELYEKLDKSLLNSFPLVSFNGPVYEVSSVEDMQKALHFLSRQPMIGIDSETRPSFQKGKMHKVSLLQLATRNECFLIHLNVLGVTPELVALFEDEKVMKVGLSLSDDIKALQRRKQFQPANFVDIQSLFPHLGVTDMSLQKLYGNVFHERISKREQLSNWERLPLTEKQQRYAATDAWACLMLYDEYLRLMESHDYIVKKEDSDEL